MSYSAVYVGTAPVLYLDSAQTAWTRPAWPALADLTSLNNRFTGIYGVDETDSNFVSVLVATSTGTWTIDWGDGMIESGLTSNVKRDHLYNYATIVAGVVGGYKPVVVTVTTSGGNITTFSLQQKHSQATLPFQAFAVNWLDIAINASSMTSLAIGGTNVTLDKLQQCKIYNHSVTSMNAMFNYCASLQSIPLFNTSAVTNMSNMFRFCFALQSVPLFVTSAVTNMSNMFYSCYSLRSVPLFVTSAVTNMNQMFYYCQKLQSVPLFATNLVTDMNGMFRNCNSLQSVPLFTTSAVTDMSNMFSSCTSLQSVPLFVTNAVRDMNNMFFNCVSLKNVPLFVTSAVTNMSYMFNYCYSLTTVPLFVTNAVTNMSYMFGTCSSLQSVPLFVTSAVTNMSNMFNECSSLTTVPLFVTNVVTDMSNMFNYCTSLQKIPLFVTSAVQNTYGMFSNCYSLSKARTNGLRFTIDYNNLKLSAAALNDIFTGLGTASGPQTISIANNFGSATCTRSIATAKGWSIPP